MTRKVLLEGVPVLRALRLALLALACTAATAVAQSGAEPQLIFSIGMGLAAGGGELWSLPRQGVLVVGGTEMDTLGLGRQMRPGLSATLGATYHRSPNLGFTAEGGYFGLGTEERCTPPAGGFKPDAETKNQQACASAQGDHVETSLVGFQVGIAYRFVHGGRFEPYVRASGGVGFLANSFIRTDGVITAPTACQTGGACTWPLLEGASTTETSVIATLAAGASIALAPGYRLRFEARDFMASLPVPSATANPANGLAPVGSRMKHMPVFTLGLDVVLERRRGRRY